MTKYKINHGILGGEVKPPPSKSYLNRALILASLKTEPVTIKNLNLCDDVKNLILALKKIGLIIDEFKDYLVVQNSFPECEKNNVSEIEIGEGGTTFRFFLALLSLGEKTYNLSLHENLVKRPHEALFDALLSLGAKLEIDKKKITITGGVKNLKIEIDGSKSSQFSSALYLLTFKRPDLKLHHLNLKTSVTYFELTKKLVGEFKEKNIFETPLDYSSASFFIVLSLVQKRDLFLKGLFFDEFQSDHKILEVLSSLSVFYEFTSTGLKISSSKVKLSGFDFNIEDCLDLAPPLAFLASFSKAESTLRGISNLRLKESDRVEAITYVLAFFGVESQILGDSLKIKGLPKTNYHHEIKCADDHRIVMMASLFFRALNGGVILNSEAVSKSYPNFFKDLLL